jgi:hypothetical protein
MKKKIIATTLLVGMLLGGCCNTSSAEGANERRFTNIWREGSSSVIVDNETGVQYFYHDGVKEAFMTVLVDTDGKPLVYNK